MNVKVTLEIPVEKLGELYALLTGENVPQPKHDEPVPVPEEPAVVAAPMAERPAEKPEPAQQEPEQSNPADEPVTKSMIRAKGLELTQAGKKAELENVFKKFGAAKLRDLKEEDYAEAYRLLGEL